MWHRCGPPTVAGRQPVHKLSRIIRAGRPAICVDGAAIMEELLMKPVRVC